MKKQTCFIESIAAALLLIFIIFVGGTVSAQTFPVTVTDQTQTAPLSNPTPSSYQPRYVSGFGQDNTFTVFFEDRDAGGTISFVQTTTGPTGFPSAATSTNITDTHFCVKDWPITISSINYAYRAWGSVGNNQQHHFYVSNDLINWTLVSTFTIPNAPAFTSARGWVYYGFHDVIKLNGTYYAFAESNQGQTMLVRSANGDDVWEAFDKVGGTQVADGPLQLPESVTPSGSFVDLGHDRGYGKIHIRGNDSGFYLAINTAAKASLSPAALEAAFINPANWTWHDGTTGLASTPILSATAEHDLRECWVVPNTDPDADWTIIYDADFGSGDGGKALGYAGLTPPLPPPHEVWVDDDWNSQGDVNGYDPSLIWQYNAFNSLQDGIDAVPSGSASDRSIVNVFDGTYGSSGTGTSCEGYPGAILIKDLDYLTIQAMPGNEPVVAPTTMVEVNVVSIVVENSDFLIIDNIDSDQSVAQFDNWHFCSDHLTLRNSRFTGGEDGIDFSGNLTEALIENNEFIDINTGSGDEVLDFTDPVSYSNVVIQDNYFENNYRQITIKPEGTGTASDFTIRRNFMNGTTSQEAIRLIGASDIIVENNAILNSTQQGIYIDNGSADITVRHNTFFNNGSDPGDNGEIKTKVTSSDIVIKNNIIHGNGSNPAFETTALSLPGEDYNLVYNTIDNVLFTFGANTITGSDPLFVSTTAGSEDLHLQASSPAIAAGTDLGVTDDIEKNVRPQPALSNPDLGAYESEEPLLPMALKEGVRDDLAMLLPTGDNKTDERIEKAIEKIDKSLEPDLWEDDSHLTKEGKKVFEEEKKAVHELMKIVDDGGPYVVDAQDAIDDLVDVDMTLAQIAIDEAQAACTAEIDPEEQEKCQKEVDKANEEMAKAGDELSMGDFDKAIEHYKKAWDHAEKALKKTMDPLGPGAGELVNDSKPTSFALEHNYPNPFNPETNIQYALPEVSRVVLKIYNVRGQLVRTLVDEVKAAGFYTVRWDGKDSNGLSVPSGAYFYRIRAGENFIKTNKMMLIK